MSPKNQKSNLLWYSCDKCGCILCHRDLKTHLEFCPQNTENWSHDYGFILNQNLYSQLEQTLDTDDGIPHLTNDTVLLSQSAMQLCQLIIGEKAVIRMSNNYCEIKIVWPTSKGSLTSVYCSKDGLTESWGLKPGPVVVGKLDFKARPASEISIEVTKLSDMPKSTEHFLANAKHKLQGKILCIGTKLSISFYGKRIRFIVTKVESILDKSADEDLDIINEFNAMKLQNDCEKFYEVCESTKFLLTQPKESESTSDLSEKIERFGGYKDILEDLKEAITFSLKNDSFSNKGLKLSSGVLLYGMNGTGKSHLAQTLIKELNVNSVSIQSGDVFSKFYGETESKLRSLFKKAIDLAPSVILLDDVDTICPKRKGSDQERRVVATVLTLFDTLEKENVFVIATTSQPHILDPALRRPGRLDREVELLVPSPADREDILGCLLERAGCGEQLDAEAVRSVACAAHGFVAADLCALVSQAQIHAVRRQSKCISLADMEWALSQVKPSAMREVYVQVPNVRWSDIGGQDDLKMKLRQAVEWPIRHPEAFSRLGINPPKGVLMYGPPGCSKTMIAKALATESKLNFISIKGSELFSKYVGESERAVRTTFKRARSVAPSIVFFDEIDALAGERGDGTAGRGGACVQERVLAQLLTELDGVEPLSNVSVVAATNRPDRIDKALLRPGRLDRLVYVPLPDLETRKQILMLQFRKIPISDSLDIDELAALTDGYSGAEVVAVCQEAALAALEEDISAAEVGLSHFSKALSLITPRTSKALLALYEKYGSH